MLKACFGSSDDEGSSKTPTTADFKSFSRNVNRKFQNRITKE